MRDFIVHDDLKNRKFALYGASKGGELVLRHFETIGFEDRVDCFIDSDPQKQGKIFHGRTIYSIDFLKDNPQVAVVISSIFIEEIYAFLLEHGCKNDIFTSFTVFGVEFFYKESPSYNVTNGGLLSVDIPYIKSFYDPYDEYTDNVIRTFHYAHTSVDYCAIQPIEKTIKIVPLPVTKYWCYEKTVLPAESGLTMCDAGAFIGDSLLQWIESYGENLKMYYGFEPDKSQFQRLIEQLEESGMKNRSKAFPVGLGDKNASLRFRSCGRGSYITDQGDTVVETARLDDLKIDVIGKLCIKMDIEGFELEALRGAEETIKKYKPELAICLYHKLEDIYKIPEYIKSIVPEYSCVIRGGSHAVCYARAN